MLAAWTFVLFVAFLTEPTQSEITYMARCNYDATFGFSATVEVEKAATDTIYQIAALTLTNSIAVGCTVTQVGTTNLYTSTYMLDTTGAILIPAACGTAFISVDSNSDGTADEVTFTFLVQSIDSYIFNTDAIFKWKCTTSDHNNVIIETFTIASLPVNNLDLKSQLTLDVHNNADGVRGSTLTPTLVKNRQIGIYVNRLVFYEGTDSTTSPNVISIDSGCIQTVPAYGLTNNFFKSASSVLPVGGGAAAGGTDGIYATDSGMFEPALWLKSTGISTNLKIEAEIVQCMLTDQSKCDDPQTNACSEAKRRRRAAEDTGLQNLTTLGTRFTISLLAGSNDQISGTKDDKGTTETCYQTYTFWIVVLVFGILMLLCLIFAVYLFFRLRREKQSRRKTEEKYGAINPAF